MTSEKVRRKSKSRASASSRLGGPALEREEPARVPLNEQDDGDEDDDLAEHRPGHRLEEIVDDAQPPGADQRTGETADAAADADEGAGDGVDGAGIGTDIADLAERHVRPSGESG